MASAELRRRLRNAGNAEYNADRRAAREKNMTDAEYGNWRTKVSLKPSFSRRKKTRGLGN